jgi:hypothetical protein
MFPRARKWTRIGFAGPGAIIIALVIMAGMSLWLPRGSAGIDARLGRVVAVALGLLALHAAIVAHKFLDRPAPVTATSEAPE